MASDKPKPKNAMKELTLLGHLDELRTRLIWSVSALVLATLGSMFFAAPALEFLIRPVTVMAAASAEPIEIEDRGQVALVVEADGSVRLEGPENLRELEQIDHLVLELLPTQDDPTTRTVDIIGQSGRKRGGMIYHRPLDPLMMQLKVAVVMGILISLVVWVWQIWLFVAPGLTVKEKSVVRPLLVAAIVLFPIGAAFAYWMFFLIIQVMQQYVVAGIETLYTVQDYLKVMTNLMIAFGFIFELPLVIALLARIGIVTPAFLRHYRRHIYVGLAVISMLITPADPFSMLMALAPLLLLFEVSVLVAGPMSRMRAKEFDDSGA